MATNPLIALGVQSMDTATPLLNFAQMRRQDKQDAQNSEVAKRQNELLDAKIYEANLGKLSAREKQRLESTMIGSAQLNGYLEAGDTDGARQFLMNRRQNLQNRMAEGSDIDTAETDQALSMLDQDPEGLKKLTGNSIKVGQMLGILKTPQANGGATDHVVQKIMADNPNMTYTQALQQYQTGFRNGTMLDAEGNVAAMPGYTDTRRDIKYSEKRGEQDAVKDTARDIKIEEGGGKNTADKTARFPQATASLRAAEARMADTSQRVDEILPRINKFTAGWGGQKLSEVSGTDAADLRADIDTLLARSGFDELQAMRDNSPTGGALGSITEQEIKFLQALKSNIQQSQSPEQLKKNITKFQSEVQSSYRRAKDAYEDDFSEQLSAQGGAQPASGGKKIRWDQL